MKLPRFSLLRLILRFRFASKKASRINSRIWESECRVVLDNEVMGYLELFAQCDGCGYYLDHDRCKKAGVVDSFKAMVLKVPGEQGSSYWLVSKNLVHLRDGYSIRMAT